MFAAIICVKIKTFLLVAAWMLLFLLPSLFGVTCALLQKRSLCFHAFPSFTCEVLGAQRCIQGAFIELTLVQFSCVSPDLAV